MVGDVSGFGALALLFMGVVHVASLLVVAWAFVREKQINRQQQREMHQMVLALTEKDIPGALAASMAAADMPPTTAAPALRRPITPH